MRQSATLQTFMRFRNKIALASRFNDGAAHARKRAGRPILGLPSQAPANRSYVSHRRAFRWATVLPPPRLPARDNIDAPFKRCNRSSRRASIRTRLTRKRRVVASMDLPLSALWAPRNGGGAEAERQLVTGE